MNSLEQELKTILAQICNCNVDSIQLEQRLREDLGMDSLNFLELEFEIQQLGAPELSDEEIIAIQTVQDALQFVLEHSKEV